MDGANANLHSKDKEQQVGILQNVIKECKEMLQRETEQGAVRQELRVCNIMRKCSLNC